MDSQKNKSADSNLVLVEINGRTLSARELDEQVQARQAQGGGSAEGGKAIRLQVVRDFITQVLLEDEAAARGITVPPETVAAAEKEMASRLPPGMKLEEVLAQAGIAPGMIKARLESELRVRRLVEGELAKVPAATAEEAEAFYGKQQGQGAETASARHILVMSDAKDGAEARAGKQAKVEGLRQRILDGADFAALAKEHSDCPSGAEGGSLGTLGRGQMVPAFEEAVFTQALNTVGPVVVTPFGFHLIEVTARGKQELAPFAEEKGRIVEYLTQRKKQAAFMEFISGLQEKATLLLDPSLQEEMAGDEP